MSRFGLFPNPAGVWAPRRPRTVEITDHSVKINGLDISDMVTATDIHLDPNSFPTVTLHSSPDVFSFTGTALVDDPRLDAGDGTRTAPESSSHFRDMLDGIGRHEVDGIERLRRRDQRWRRRADADAWGLTSKQFLEALARQEEAVG